MARLDNKLIVRCFMALTKTNPLRLHGMALVQRMKGTVATR